MEKRVHSKKISNHLTCRHYLFHFKWPLLGFFFMSSFLICLQINLHYVFSPNVIHEEQIDPFDMNVIYPIDIFNNEKVNTSINYYFFRKDEMKIIENANAAIKKQKVILPLVKNQSLLNSYLILEFTNVFGQPRFCSHTNEQIFGTICPYTNW